jgi:hypothetical protein
MSQTTLYILQRKSPSGSYLWMLALIPVNTQGSGSFYHVDPSERNQFLPSGSPWIPVKSLRGRWPDDNSTPYREPLLDSDDDRVLHGILSGINMDEYDDKWYVLQVLYNLERGLVLPQGTFAYWQEKLQSPSVQPPFPASNASAATVVTWRSGPAAGPNRLEQPPGLRAKSTTNTSVTGASMLNTRLNNSNNHAISRPHNPQSPGSDRLESDRSSLCSPPAGRLNRGKKRLLPQRRRRED